MGAQPHLPANRVLAIPFPTYPLPHKVFLRTVSVTLIRYIMHKSVGTSREKFKKVLGVGESNPRAFKVRLSINRKHYAPNLENIKRKNYFQPIRRVHRYAQDCWTETGTKKAPPRFLGAGRAGLTTPPASTPSAWPCPWPACP